MAVGKDEVPSSNLGSSSTNPQELRFSRLFCCKSALFCVSQNEGHRSDPHRDPHGERAEKLQRVPGRRFVLPVRLFLSVLHDLLHDVSQGLGRFVLLLPCCVGNRCEGWVKPASKCPSMEETVFTSTPFCRAVVAKVCRRSWNLKCSSPASFRIFLWRFTTESGWYISPVRGEGKR